MNSSYNGPEIRGVWWIEKDGVRIGIGRDVAADIAVLDIEFSDGAANAKARIVLPSYDAQMMAEAIFRAAGLRTK